MPTSYSHLLYAFSLCHKGHIAHLPQGYSNDGQHDSGTRGKSNVCWNGYDFLYDKQESFFDSHCSDIAKRFARRSELPWSYSGADPRKTWSIVPDPHAHIQ